MKQKEQEETSVLETSPAGVAKSLTRRQFIQLTAGAAVVVGTGIAGSALAAGKPKLDTPDISCGTSTANTIKLHICAGASGAAAGFSVQWMTRTAFEDNGNAWYLSDDPRLCKASFSGNANQSNWNLGPGDCVDVVIGGLNDADPGVSFTCNDPLKCETRYVFRVFAHNVPKGSGKSDFTGDLECTTAACLSPAGWLDGDFCTKSQGYYGGNGMAGRATLIGCYGGDPTGATCTSTAGNTIITIGGGTYTYTWTTTGTCVDLDNNPNKVFWLDDGINAVRQAIGGGGNSGYFTADGSNATSMGSGGGLASQTAALTLNIALSGAACSGFASALGIGGYGNAKLCNFEEGDYFQNSGNPISAATAALLNTQTVNDVLAATNAYLGGNGAIPVPYGLANAGVLNELISQLNLAFDGSYTDAGNVEHECGGMSAFAESHLCP